MNLQNNDLKGGIDDIEKKEYYKVPDGYFERLPQIIQSKAIKSPRTQSRGIFVPVFKYSIPLAAIALLVYFGMFQSGMSNEPSNLLSNISAEEAYTYFEEMDMNSIDLVLATVSQDELEEFLNIPSVAEEYLLEESLLEDIDWMESSLNEVVDI